MNRIFKTVWNVARRALVVASEKAGIGQSRRAVRGGASEPVNSVVPQRVTGNLGKRAFVLSGLPLALAGVFVLWGGNAEAAFPIHSASPVLENADVFGAFNTVDGGGYEPDTDPDPEPDPVITPYFMNLMTPTEMGGWKYLYNDVRYLYEGADWGQFNMVVWNEFVDTRKTAPEVKHFYLVFGAETQWTQAGYGYVTTSNLFSVGENPTDLNVNAANFPERDEIGFWGSAGNFTVEDGKTLVLFGEAPLNGSYLGEGKTGTVRDGTLTFGLPYKFSEFKDGLSSGDTGTLVLYDGANVVFQNGVYSTSRIGIQPESNVRITVTDSAIVTLQSADFNVIDSLADGNSSEGVIENVGSGSLTISGGTEGYSTYGIFNNAFGSGSTGMISNTGAGTLTITGGSNHEAHAIFYNASGFGSIGTFSNTGKGTLTIMGGEGSVATGIHSNAYYGGSGTISNIGSGKLTITGGSGSAASGIYFNAEGENSTAIITNTGDEGVLTISGGSSGNGIDFNALDGGKGIISNTGRGTLIITGSSKSGADGIYRNAYRNESTATISNTGSGTLTITGGSGNNADGISINASVSDPLSEETVNVIISNEGAGILNITGGSGEGSYGIRSNANNRGTGTITNGVSGTLNILGNVDSGSCGIRDMTSGTVSTGRLGNAGEMNLNANAIGSFGDGDVLVTNYSTGTVNAEVEAIFEKAGGSATVDSEIVVLNPEDGMNGNTAVNGFGSSGTSIAWDLKDDWRLHSKWEDGGVLNITDVVEGSLAAQQIEAAFTSKFGNGTQLNFIGEDDWASEGVGSSEDAFTASIGNALIDQGYAGNIVTNFNLNNSASDGSAQALTIGEGTGEVIKDSIGFRQIEGVSSVTVNNGKYFALIGLPAGGELIEGGAPVTLDNGTLMLGVTPAESARTDSSTAGTLETVTMKNGSKIETENMWVRIDSVKGNGDVMLTDTGRLYVKDLNVKGDVTNDGTLSADTLTVSGTLETSKTLKSSGTIAVDSGSKLVADGYVVADKLDVKGVMIRGITANVFTGAAAMDLLREANAEAAAEVDRVEGKSEVSTLSVLDRIVAASMKTTTEDTTDDQTETNQEASHEEASKAPVVVSSKRRASPVLPQDAQAFAAFDAVNRITTDIDAGGTPDANGLWVKLMTGESEFGVRSGAKFEVDSDGAVIGAEAKIKPVLKVGAALSYLDGEIDSGSTKNDWKSYGLTAYAHYRTGDFGLKGSAGWLRGTTEATEDFDADVWHAGLRAEYDLFKGKSMMVTPFLGGRVMSGSFDSMASQTVVNVPLGVKFAGELSTAGWTVTPALEASYVRSMGDTESEDVRFLPENVFAGALSLKAEKGAWTGELSLRGAAGSNDYEDRSFMAKIGLKF